MTEEYAKKTVSLTNMLRDKIIFQWTKRENKAFKQLKRNFAQESALEIYNSDEETAFYIDASNRAIEFCITQKERSLRYYSRKLTSAKINYITTDKKMLVIITSLIYWKIYTREVKKKIIVYIDHKNLLSLLYDKELNQRQLKWTKEITHYDFKIRHIKEIENTVANSFNRRADYEIAKKINKSLLKKREAVLKKTKSSEEIEDIIRKAHQSRTMKHQRITKTLKRV